MKRLNTCFIGLILLQIITLKAYALSFTISFTASGASNSAGTVQVQNLRSGATLVVPAGNVLNLYDGTTTATNDINISDKKIMVYPNPVIEKTTISFFAKQNGESQIQVFSIDGKMAIESTHNCQIGENSFQLSLPKGLFTVKIEGNGYSYATKVLSKSTSNGKATVIFNGDVKQAISTQKKIKSGVSSMYYYTGDRLLFTGVSGNYRTNIVDVPTESKTVNFNFVECKDGDNNYYTVVQIGTQRWMVENLRTTKYKNGDAIGTTATSDANISSEQSPKYQWPFNGDESLVVTYGRLYTWNVVNDSRGLAPNGWHVASNADWATLQDYLIANGYNYDKTKIDNKTAKSLASNSGWSTGWNPTTPIGTPANDLTSNNSTGLSIYPSAGRFSNGFYSIGLQSMLWTQTESDTYAITVYINNDDCKLYLNHVSSKSLGWAVRCVMD